MTKKLGEQQVAEVLSRVRAAEGLISMLEDFALPEEHQTYLATATDSLRVARQLLGDKELLSDDPSTQEIPAILVVDDDAVQRLWVSRALGKAGFRVEAAHTGHEALERSAQRKWSLILVDCEIPNPDGFEVVQQIRSSGQNPNQETPIIAYSGYEIRGYKERCIQVGMNSFLQKPALKEQLLQMVLSHLHGAEVAEK